MKRIFQVTINNQSHDVELLERTRNSITFSVQGETHTAIIEAPLVLQQDKPATGSVSTRPLRERDVIAAAPGSVVAPMPGIVVKALCAAGQKVTRDTPLVIIEAMKMENTIAAPCSGTVLRVAVLAGEEVKKGQLLVEMSAD